MLTKFFYANVLAKKTVVIITIDHFVDITDMVYRLANIGKTMYNVFNSILLSAVGVWLG